MIGVAIVPVLPVLAIQSMMRISSCIVYRRLRAAGTTSTPTTAVASPRSDRPLTTRPLPRRSRSGAAPVLTRTADLHVSYERALHCRGSPAKGGAAGQSPRLDSRCEPAPRGAVVSSVESMPARACATPVRQRSSGAAVGPSGKVSCVSKSSGLRPGSARFSPCFSEISIGRSCDLQPRFQAVYHPRIGGGVRIAHLSSERPVPTALQGHGPADASEGSCSGNRDRSASRRAWSSRWGWECVPCLCSKSMWGISTRG